MKNIGNILALGIIGTLIAMITMSLVLTLYNENATDINFILL
jgi:hypothetical protein